METPHSGAVQTWRQWTLSCLNINELTWALIGCHSTLLLNWLPWQQQTAKLKSKTSWRHFIKKQRLKKQTKTKSIQQESFRGRGFFRAEGAVSSREGAVLEKQSSHMISLQWVTWYTMLRCHWLYPVSMVTAYLSCRGAAASCLEGASPLELLDQEASPSEDP